MFRKAILFLIFLRLLWPPGICICHLFDREHTHHDHDDHLPGCPASKIAITLCSMKQDAPRLSDAPAPPVLLLVIHPVVVLVPATLRDDAPSIFGPLEPPLYLTLRALLI